MVKVKTTVRLDTRKLRLIPKLVERGIIKGLKKGAFEIERKAKQFAPIDTGALIRSISTDIIEKGANSISISVSPKVNYAARMERPGRVLRRGRRPYLKPALIASKNKIVFWLKTEISRAIGGK